MNIYETAATIRLWIESCINEEQIELCNDAIQKFIMDRFIKEDKFVLMGEVIKLANQAAMKRLTFPKVEKIEA